MKKLYLPEGITREERTGKLNSRMRSVKPSICVERARFVTESYAETVGESAMLRRAKALRHTLEKMTIFIDDEELTVGNHGCRPRSAPLFPEFGAFSRHELDMMPTRKVDTLEISEEDKEYLLSEIYPRWQGVSTESRAGEFIAPEDMALLEPADRVFDPISRTRSGYGHYIPDIERVLKGGFRAIEESVGEGQSDFCEAARIICGAARDFALRYSRLAADMAKDERDERRRRELELISESCARVPYLPPRNLFEALQSYWFTILIDYISQNGSAISAGRFDRFMEPFYERDIAEKRITREEAREMLEAIFVKHSDVIKAGSFNSARNNGGFATTINITLGDRMSDFSLLCLEADSSVFNSEPNISIRVSESTDDGFLMKVMEILSRREGGKYPFFNDDAIIPALIADGVEPEDAENYGLVGCVEPTGCGDTMGMTNCCYFNMAKCMELALCDGASMLTGEQMGPHTGDARSFTEFSQLEAAYEKQIEFFTGRLMGILDSIERLHMECTPHIYSSLLLKGCVENEKDAVCGGAKYSYAGVQGVGAVDVGDSLAAVKKLVFDDKKITMERLIDALKNDFEGEEELHALLIRGAPKYGNDIDGADVFTAHAAAHYCGCFKGRRDARGGTYRPGLFCLSSNTPLGRGTAALPSGRRAHTPLADGGISPKHGMDKKGPTAAAKSVAKLDHAAAVNGVNFNLKFLPSLLAKEENRKKLLALVRTYFSLGGFHVQFNIVTAERLRAAQEHPEADRGLVVRVAGYSAFFVELDRDIQNEIIDRTVQNG